LIVSNISNSDHIIATCGQKAHCIEAERGPLQPFYNV